MASPTLKELSYRRFDDLLNEVRIDLPSFEREGMVEPGQLIKIAQECNYDLGLKIHGTKETMIEVEHGRAKLPSDFYILNLALLCGHYQTCEPGLFNGLHTENVAVPLPDPNITSCPCWTILSTGAQVTVTKCDNTVEFIYFPPNDDGSVKTTKMCAKSFEVTGYAPGGTFTYSTDHFCFNDPATGSLTCDNPNTGCCIAAAPTDSCGAVDADPWHQNRVYTTCNNTMQVNVIEYHSNEIRQYNEFEKIHMRPSKEATDFCVNTQFRDAAHQGHIRDGFLWVPTLRDHHHFQGTRRVYICYLGAMEDENGNLLVLDHPKINQFYEWALKKRIFMNLHLNGEPDIERRLALIDKEYKFARAEALTLAATPDFYEFKKTIEMNRRAMYHKYMHPFSSLYANTPGWPWSYNNEYI